MIKLQRNLFQGDYPLTQRFGQNPDWYAPFGMKGHNGLDYGIPTGTPLYSCINGTVTEIAWDKTGYGKYIKIENDECGVLYGHMNTMSSIPIGTYIEAGTMIGPSGNTGNSTGPHLHFGVFPKPRDRSNGYAGYIDPLDRSLVTWVDNLNEQDDMLDENIKLQQMIDELSVKLSDERDKHAEDIANKNKIIDQYEKQVKELTVQLVSARQTMSDTSEEVKSIREDLRALQEVHEAYKAEKGAIIADLEELLRKREDMIEKLGVEVAECKKKYSAKISKTSWLTFIWQKLKGGA